ncbi:hypothetical protein TcWFU_009947 [Taenia crassiceps]|uniref:Uncharacterized protein n=1 Tax=Taenia crassiceps TaxID=6207 RepID=A0ABR4Q2Q1_9CEST
MVPTLHPPTQTLKARYLFRSPWAASTMLATPSLEDAALAMGALDDPMVQLTLLLVERQIWHTGETALIWQPLRCIRSKMRLMARS